MTQAEIGEAKRRASEPMSSKHVRQGGDKVAATQDLLDIEYKRIDERTILVTKGLNYNRRAVLEEFRQKFSPVFIVTIEDKICLTKNGGGVFLARPALSEEENQEYEKKLKEAKGYTIDERGFYDSIGMKWVFVNPRMSFTVKNMVFETLSKDATMEFKQEGVLLRGFEIRPKKREDPLPCEKECEEWSTKGQLLPGVTIEECIKRLCK